MLICRCQEAKTAMSKQKLWISDFWKTIIIEGIWLICSDRRSRNRNWLNLSQHYGEITSTQVNKQCQLRAKDRTQCPKPCQSWVTHFLNYTPVSWNQNILVAISSMMSGRTSSFQWGTSLLSYLNIFLWNKQKSNNKYIYVYIYIYILCWKHKNVSVPWN